MWSIMNIAIVVKVLWVPQLLVRIVFQTKDERDTVGAKVVEILPSYGIRLSNLNVTIVP